MRISGLNRCVLGICAAAMLASCGALLQAQPFDAAKDRNDGVRAKSWMMPEAKGQDLLYVSDTGTNDVYVFGYGSGKLLGTLTGFDAPKGECVDKNGNVFVTNSIANEVVEYAHGASEPLQTITGLFHPMDCAVDPKSGSLAVTYQYGVALYQHAQGTPETYSICVGTCESYEDAVNDTYDGRGNLYVVYQYYVGSGSQAHGVFAVYRLAGSSFKQIWDYGNCECPVSGLQWDGRHLAVGIRDEIAQITRSGREVDELYIPSFAYSFWIENKTLVWPTGHEVDVYTYPRLTVKKTLTGLGSPYGATVSVARKS